jgi:molybdopterin-guanine dinucleotide biosynthesis protein A
VIWDAVVLAGGRGRRLGGVDKPALLLDGRSLLDRALAATAGARHRVVVGPERPVPRAVRLVREEPPLGGPVAALAAGLRALPADDAVVVVLAADLPAVEAALPAVLAATQRAAAGPGRTDGCIAVDPEGRDQPLLAAYRGPALRAALATLTQERGLDGAALRALVPRLALLRVPLAADLCADVDEPADANRAGIPLPAARSLEPR